MMERGRWAEGWKLRAKAVSMPSLCPSAPCSSTHSQLLTARARPNGSRLAGPEAGLRELSRPIIMIINRSRTQFSAWGPG